MILSEVAAFTKSDLSFSAAIAEFVDRHGVKVFQGGQATVIDRGTYVWRAWFNDPGYERFLKYLEGAADSPHLPTVMSKLREEVAQFKGLPRDVTVKYVKLEKLTPIKDLAFKDSINALSFCNLHASKIPKDIVELLSRSDSFTDTGTGSIEPELFRNQVLKNSKFFTLALDLMRNHRANDISDENVMMRGSVPVIIDPFCFT